MSQSLVAFDTDRIKGYVFATDTLKEIRGASDILNGWDMSVDLRVRTEGVGNNGDG